MNPKDPVFGVICVKSIAELDGDLRLSVRAVSNFRSNMATTSDYSPNTSQASEYMPMVGRSRSELPLELGEYVFTACEVLVPRERHQGPWLRFRAGGLA